MAIWGGGGGKGVVERGQDRGSERGGRGGTQVSMAGCGTGHGAVLPLLQHTGAVKVGGVQME